MMGEVADSQVFRGESVQVFAIFIISHRTPRSPATEPRLRLWLDSRGRLSPHFRRAFQLPDVAGVFRHHGLPGFAAPCLLESRHFFHHPATPLLATPTPLAN